MVHKQQSNGAAWATRSTIHEAITHCTVWNTRCLYVCTFLQAHDMRDATPSSSHTQGGQSSNCYLDTTGSYAWLVVKIHTSCAVVMMSLVILDFKLCSTGRKGTMLLEGIWTSGVQFTQVLLWILCYWRRGHEWWSADSGQVGVIRAVGEMQAEPEDYRLLVGLATSHPLSRVYRPQYHLWWSLTQLAVRRLKVECQLIV